jgi:hypothetical protein
MRAKLPDRLAPVRRFRHDCHIRVHCDQAGDALSHDGMIVDTENADALGIVAHESPVSL